jgi:hypothetical protein
MGAYTALNTDNNEKTATAKRMIGRDKSLSQGKG